MYGNKICLKKSTKIKLHLIWVYVTFFYGESNTTVFLFIQIFYYFLKN